MAETRARFLANTIGATSASNDFTLPDGVGTNKQVLETDGAGGTSWVTSLTAPTISSVTGTLNEYEDGVSEDGGVLTINGTDFGADSSALSVQISGTTGFAVIAETSTISITSSGTQFTATFTGAETNYNHSSFAAGSTIYVKVTKSGLQTSTYGTLATAMTGDPSFSTTSTTASSHTGTLASTSLGSYGGQVAGGGQDSNTKLLLNFDRTSGTDIEDSSNTGGNGHKVTATNAVIKASPFGDGKSAMFFGTNSGSSDNEYLTIPQISNSFAFGTGAFTIECWVMFLDDSTNDQSFIHTVAQGQTAADTQFNVIWNGNPSSRHKQIIFNSGNAAKHTGGTLMVKDRWYHVAVVRDGSSNLNIYIDGKKSGSTYTTSWDISAGHDLEIGRGANNGGNAAQMYLDEVRICKGLAVYTGDFTVPTSRLSTTWVANPFGGSNTVANNTASNVTLLIHSNLGGEKVHFGVESQRTYTISTSVTANSGYNDVTKLIDGLSENDYFWTVQDNTNKNVTIDLGTGNSEVFNKFIFKQNSSGHNHGDWQIQVAGEDGSFSDASNGTIGDLGDALIYEKDFTNTTAYRYYRILGTGDDTSASPYIYEFGFANNTFTDSSESGHNITATGAYHSQGHGGIAPAMSWPTNKKATGSAGVYFDSSNSDYLILGADTSGSTLLLDATTVGSIDFWMYAEQLGDYPLSQSSDLYKHTSLVSKGDIISGFKLTSDGGLLHHYWNSGHNVHCKTSANVVTANQWYHLCMAWDNNRISIFVDGVLKATSTTVTRFKVNTHTDAYGPRIGWHRTWSDGYFHGYIDNFRIVQGSLPMDTTGDPLHSSTAFSSMTSVDTTYFSKPTEIYGAYRSQDVGTIQLNATAGTGGGALDYAELSGGTALSTYGLSLSSSGAITGTLTGLDENSNSGGVIRIRARANADDKRLTTLGGASFTGITQNDGKAPVLFNARRYHGTGSTRDINGFGFQPDFCWIKARNESRSHFVWDSVTDLGDSPILPDTNSASIATAQGHISSFNADGITIADGSSGDLNVNDSGDQYIFWSFKAGGAPSSSALSLSGGVGAGTIANDATGVSGVTSITQSVNQNSGFSITKYTGGGGDTASFPHNLGGTPDFIIIKNLDESRSWVVWHKNLTNATNSDNDVYNLWLDLNAQQYNATSGQHDHGAIAGPSSTVINVRKSGQADIGGVNQNTKKYICYAWKAVVGVSAMGSYEGNSTSGSVTPQTITFPNVGGVANQFAPSFVMIKSIDSSDSWWMFDNARVASGVRNNTAQLRADEAHSEATNSSSTLGVTLKTDNGFTVHDYGSGVNGNGNTYIYMAFA